MTRAVRFAKLGRHLEWLAERLPRRILRATLGDVRSRIAHLQQDVDATWLCLFRLIDDIDLWNRLVAQKDQFFTALYVASLVRLRRKFITLFVMCPNHPYCSIGCNASGPLTRTRNDVLAQECTKRSSIIAEPNQEMNAPQSGQNIDRLRMAYREVLSVSDESSLGVNSLELLYSPQSEFTLDISSFSSMASPAPFGLGLDRAFVHSPSIEGEGRSQSTDECFEQRLEDQRGLEQSNKRNGKELC